MNVIVFKDFFLGCIELNMFLFIFGNGVNGLNVDVVNSVIVMKFFIFKYI